MQKIEYFSEAIFFTELVKCLKIMGWENYSSELENALITNSFGDKLPRELKNIHGKTCTSKCVRVCLESLSVCQRWSVYVYE